MSKPIIAVLIATDSEFSACYGVAQGIFKSRVAFASKQEILLDFPSAFVFLRQIEAMGNLDAAVEVEGVLSRYHPLLVIGVGICATPKKSSFSGAHCDLIVGTEVVYYEPKKKLPRNEEWRPRYFRSSFPPELAQRIVAPPASDYQGLVPPRRASPNPRVFPGLYASGDGVISDPRTVDRLQASVQERYGREIAAIEMEAAGIARACETLGTPFLLVKAVSDHATSEKNDDWQRCAAGISFAAVLRWVQSISFDDLDMMSLARFAMLPTDPYAKAVRVVRVAGSMLPMRGVLPSQVIDQGIDDLVTPWDTLSERLIAAWLETDGVGFFAEELQQHRREDRVLARGRWWVVDPVDGTQNLVAGRPEVAISVALVDDGEVEFGIVGMPFRGIVVGASRQPGVEVDGLAWSRRRPVPRRLEEAVIGLPGDLRRLRTTGVDRLFSAILPRVAGIRVTGALAYDLAALAMGEIDARISTSAKTVDVAAGLFLVEQAGGIVTDLRGAPWVPGGIGLLAAASIPLHAALLEIVADLGLPLWE
ncbi:inositol monophosphatase family protein [Nannocystis sp.]|uniref:inositol monophosphatase family protein n=1 Tax=Nannocystis sp. TaxID=1962667 RepID=UPI002425A0AB|nr:inositol monophosphatase family protein [Nannocystis sp.]MBK7830358.1 hypothetical protein [Nannocystis sp.]MBK9752331.1 hypothetical protein [Nannocystis sp.]